MAVFEQRRELNKQKKHLSAQWDDSFGLKLLGFDKQGRDNAFGQVLNFIPGVNTARHAAAMGMASKDTKNVLKDTFDETVGRDLAGASFAVNLAKTIGTGGIGGTGGAMSGLFKGGAKGLAGAADVAGGALGMAGEAAQGAEGLSGVAGGIEKGMDAAAGALGTQGEADKGMVDSLVAEKLVNPYEEGTDEYDMWEEKKSEQQGMTGGKIKEMGKDFLGSMGGGNIFESAGNLAATSIADYRAQNEAFSKYAKGTFADPGEFNYL